MKTNLVRLSLALSIATLVIGCGDNRAPDASGTLPATTQAPQAANPEAVAVSAHDAPAVAAGGYCALDTVDGAPAAGATATAGAQALFSGWIADQAKQVPADARLVFRGEAGPAYTAPLVAGGLRPDVVAALDADALAASGYNVVVELDLVPGTYGLSILHGQEGQEQECALVRTLVVAE